MQNGPRTYNAASLIVGDCKALPTRMRPLTREISQLQTEYESQGKGDATELMHRVCREADLVGITLVLWPRPYGDIALSAGQLAEWYAKRFGFALIQATPPLMARMPGATPRYLTPIAQACESFNG